MAKKNKKELTVKSSMADFRRAYQAKKKLLEREKDDFLFALGDQWDKKDVEVLKAANIKPITDNRIAPNIFLLTGLERQNRSDFKAFPEGEEDTTKADVASALFKNAIKVSDFQYKSSDQFKDGVTCGESHLELYLDNTDSLINGKPVWRKLDGNVLFPEPGFSEYDFRDCRYVYKINLAMPKEDLINLFPKKKAIIEAAGSGKLDMESITGNDEVHVQKKDYGKPNESTSEDGEFEPEDNFDLVERYYKKWVETAYVGDKQTGTIKESPDKASAESFLAQYKAGIQQNQQAFEQATQAHSQHVQGLLSQHVNDKIQAEGDPTLAAIPPEQHLAELNQMGKIPPPPPPPPPQDPERFLVITRMVPEIWRFAHAPGIEEPLDDARAWFYPKWKNYPFVPYFARFSTAPLKGEESHLLIQGIVNGVKGVQEKHNKAEMLMLRHLNSAANSGWEIEEDQLVDPEKLKNFGSTAGIVIERKKGTPPLVRLFPMPLSQGHAEISADSAEAIKAQMGINSDLLATQQSSGDSGRAIALRQKQGLLMVQELFDNLSRTRIIAGKFLLSQLGEIYDTETAKKILGDAFLIKNFPPLMVMAPPDPQTGQPALDPATGGPKMEPMQDQKTGQPMQYDTDMAEVCLAEVLSGDLGKYDVAVGEAVSSETQRMANSMELTDIAKTYPGLIPPDILVEESQLPGATKNRIVSSIKQAQAAAAAAPPANGPAK